MLEAAIIAAVVIIDQLTKMWVSSSLGSDVLRVIPGLFNFRYIENRGMAFGLFQNGTLILSITSAIFAAVMIFIIYRYKKKTTRPFNIFLALIAGGAIGNLIDRVFAGFVVDFIEFAFVDFAVFNFADICVTIGGIMLIVYLCFFKKGRNIVKGIDSDGRKDGEKDGKDNQETRS